MAIASSLRSFSTALFLHSPHSLSLSLTPSLSMFGCQGRAQVSISTIQSVRGAPVNQQTQLCWSERGGQLGQKNQPTDLSTHSNKSSCGFSSPVSLTVTCGVCRSWHQPKHPSRSSAIWTELFECCVDNQEQEGTRYQSGLLLMDFFVVLSVLSQCWIK